MGLSSSEVNCAGDWEVQDLDLILCMTKKRHSRTVYSKLQRWHWNECAVLSVREDK